MSEKTKLYLNSLNELASVFGSITNHVVWALMAPESLTCVHTRNTLKARIIAALNPSATFMRSIPNKAYIELTKIG